MIEGIDLSSFSGVINAAKVQAAGCAFVYLKATDGVGTIDGALMRNANAFRAAGMTDVIGAYHYLRVRHTHPQDADEQCKQFMDAATNAGALMIPPWLDVETNGNTQATKDEVRSAVELWLDTWDARNPDPATVCLYTSPGEAAMMGLTLMDDLSTRPLALAAYTQGNLGALPQPWTAWAFHQYAGNVAYAGVGYLADRIRYNGTLDQLKAM